MKKNHKIILYSALGVGALVGAYFLYKNFSASNGDNSTSREETDEEDEDIPTSAPSQPKFPLKIGSRGSDVKILQQYLNRSPMCKRKQADILKNAKPNERVRSVLPLDEDGIFGELTQSALQICYNTNTLDEKLWKRMSDSLPSLVK